MRNVRHTPVAAAILTMTLAGCVSTGGRRSAGPDAVREPIEIVVDNRNSSNSSITVYLLRAGTRERQRLGTVRLAQRTSFKVDNYLNGARYRIVARETGGLEWASDAFVITPGDVAEWRTHRSNVWVGERGDGG